MNTRSNPCGISELEIFTSAFRYAAVGMALVSPDGSWLKVNKSLCEIVEYSESELLSMKFQDITYPEDLDKDIYFVQKMLRKDIDTYQIEKRYISKCGNVIYVLLNVSLVCDQKGEPLFFISQIQDMSKMKHCESELFRMLNVDYLTNIGNRRYFFENALRELKRSALYSYSLSILIVDIDDFKRINDSFGHDVGDKVLIEVANVCKNSIRNIDLLGRIGGEEFAILLVETDFEDANIICERLRRNIERLTIAMPPVNIMVTASIGCHVFVETDSGLDVRLKNADEALYRAKTTGKNKVEYCVELAETFSEQKYHDIGFIKLVWGRRFESGNIAIDNQHRNLFDLSNDVLSAIVIGQDKATCLGLLTRLAEHIKKHFLSEEKVLESICYSDLVRHKELHRQLVESMNSILLGYMDGIMSVKELFAFLAVEVVYNHLVAEDSKFFKVIK